MASQIRKTPSVTCFAVDSSPTTNISALEMLTGSLNRVYPYERNAEFAKEISRLASSTENGKCKPLSGETRERVHAAAGVEVHEGVYSTPASLRSDVALQRDVLGEPLNVDKINEEKSLLQKKSNGTKTTITTTKRTTTPSRLSSTTTQPSTKTNPPTTTQRSTTTRSSPSTTTRLPTTSRPSTTARTSTVTQRRTTTTPPSTTTQPPTTVSKRTPRIPTSPSFPLYFPRRSTDEPEEPSTTYKPGCLLDMIIVLDSSGSVEETFLREKELAAGILSRLRIGPNNARVSIIKFAGTKQVKTVWSFANFQSKGKILRVLNRIPFTSGTTAIHSALLKYPISRNELETIVGSPDRVFTDSNIGKFHDVLESIARDCIVD
ncbi:von Willebrand factor type A domain protein [Teladorsagia circumcincta]|uniref:von Willebrand factor type A domain protein n=1 Tax=Teladorsagia circumcincta TaxID=45464 RepID=A0A2G9V3F4_TELCI|nr:von Willebrand factor type A domain protein [Teladorsagia circumcincta]